MDEGWPGFIGQELEIVYILVRRNQLLFNGVTGRIT